MIARFHDMYLTTIQGCLYKAAGPFGKFPTRKDALREYSKQLYVLADLFLGGEEDNADSPYLCGEEVSLADATLFPSMVFCTLMFPKFDHGITEKSPIPEKLEKWYENLIEKDPIFQKVHDEVRRPSSVFGNLKFVVEMNFMIQTKTY